MAIFNRADILLPKDKSFEKWSVIACDQYTSQPEYWEETRDIVGDSDSTLNLVYPEAWLNEGDARIASINETMSDYLNREIFEEYKDCYIYVERTLSNGSIRKGVIGTIDLDEYDYSDDSGSGIRATERTVIERIPPRVKIRKDAVLELPHIILLCDDKKKMLIEYAKSIKDRLPLLYDFDLMQEGGHIRGWLLEGSDASAFDEKMTQYLTETSAKYDAMGKPALYFAVGDGNHSLATAKTCYENIKSSTGTAEHPARYALVELENLWDDAQVFEPIHRLLYNLDPQELLEDMAGRICVDDEHTDDGYPIDWYSEGMLGTIYIDRKLGELPVGVIQEYLDDYLKDHEGSIDYIHDESALRSLSAREGSIGFELPAIAKDSLFVGIVKDGVLPRKTFSMGHSNEKRYYLEARKLF